MAENYMIQTNPLAGLQGFQSGLDMRQQMQGMGLAAAQEERAQLAFDTAQERGDTQWQWAQEDRARQQAEYEAQMAKQQQWQADIGTLTGKMADGSLSSQDIAGYALKYPEHAGLIRESFDSFTADRKRNDALDLSKALLSIKAGRPEVAIEALKTRAEAAENSGNKEEADAYRSVAMQIEMDPDSGFVLGGMILNELDPDMAKTVLDRREDGRQVERVRDLANGGSVTYFTDGSMLVRDGSGAELKGQAALDATKDIETSNDPAKIREIKEKLRILGIDEASPEGQDAFRTNGKSLEGMDSPEVQKLRKEWTGLPAVKTFQEQSAANGRIEAAAKDATGASDVALVFNYMKMLDPGSVVREGEFATAENTGGLDDKIVGMYNRLLSGERLTPDIRENFLKMAKRIYEDAERQYSETERQYKEIAKRNGFPESTIIDFRYQGGNPPAQGSSQTSGAGVSGAASGAAVPAGATPSAGEIDDLLKQYGVP